MKLLVTGAAGFLGAEVVRQALAAGHQVRALGLPGSLARLRELGAVEPIEADLRDGAALERAVAGIEGVIHCAAVTSEGAPDEALSFAVNVEGTRRLYLASGAARWIQISSMSAQPRVRSVYGRSKLAADEALRAAPGPVRWTILRPSLIYGPGERGLVAKTMGLLKKLPVVPIVGSGSELLRPVYVGDVARATLDCLAREATLGRGYMLGGADEVTLNEFMRRLAAAGGHPRPLLHVPLIICHFLACAMAFCIKKPPLTVDNVLGVRDLERVDHADAARDWGYSPLGLDEGLRRTFTERPLM